MILVSGCLAGQKCRYDGGSKTVDGIKEMVEKGEAIPVCPEQLGGLATPRPPVEIQSGDGNAVLDGKAIAKNSEGRDVTQNLIRGASDVLVIAKDNNVTKAILKTKSAACGCGKIYDGTFKGRLKDGDGVAAALLKRHVIKVITQDDCLEGKGG